MVNPKVVKLFGASIFVDDTDVQRPLRSFNPRTGQFIPAEDHVENIDPEPEPVPVPEAEPEPLLDDFERLVQSIEARTGARPVFLYEKCLTKSDLSRNHNRLFITRDRGLMGILTEDERRRVEDADKTIWLEVPAVDAAGESYLLHIKRWSSLNMVVLKGKHWNKVVSQNRLVAGQIVQLWAYREEDSLCLAMNFKDAH